MYGFYVYPHLNCQNDLRFNMFPINQSDRLSGLPTVQGNKLTYYKIPNLAPRAVSRLSSHLQYDRQEIFHGLHFNPITNLGILTTMYLPRSQRNL